MLVFRDCWGLRIAALSLLLVAVAPPTARGESRLMEVTAYCKCGDCNGYSRGSWKFLKLDRWNRYVNYGSSRGDKYTGKTAAGDKLREPRAGLFSGDSVRRPWTVPLKVVTAPVGGASRRYGTIAADTDYYPFGTKMNVPGWGWGVVTDRGGDIKGPDRIDIFFNRHSETLQWGRQNVEVEIEMP